MKQSRLACALILLLSLFTWGQTSANQPAATAGPEDVAHKVPVIDGAAGACSLELTVTAGGKPVYAASVKVHIAYGFGGFRKLDLEASTNVDGKVKFIGIPPRVRLQTLEFHASKDQFTGTLTYDPGSECVAKHDLALEKPTSQPGK